MTALADDFEIWLRDACLYPVVRRLDARRFACIYPLAYTHAIITVHHGDRIGFADRWCYRDLESATAALDAWDGTGEPTGWHREPSTGRRRPDGDPAREYVHD